MTPNELYSLQPISIDYRFYTVSKALESESRQTSHQMHFWKNFNSYDLNDDLIDQEKRVELRYYLNEGDDKYGAMLFSVFFDNKPLMIVQNDGKYYEEYTSYITDETLLTELENYIKSKMVPDAEKPSIFCDPEKDISGLEQVNSYNLFDYYNSTVNPQYKVNDIVWGYAPENHLLKDYNDDYRGYVLTKIKILSIQPFSIHNTYHGTQIERGWGKDYKMIITNTKSGMGCELNDALILGKVSEIPTPEEAINNFVDENGELFPYFNGKTLEQIYTSRKKNKVK